MINNLIKARIIEIVIIITLVISTIPIWNNFNEKAEAATISSKDNLNLNFYSYTYNDTDRIIVNNTHNYKKNYKILLTSKKDIYNDYIIINNESYQLSDFNKTKNRGEYIYTLIDNSIKNEVQLYEIKHNLKDKGIKFSYRFEEKNIF